MKVNPILYVVLIIAVASASYITIEITNIAKSATKEGCRYHGMELGRSVEDIDKICGGSDD